MLFWGSLQALLDFKLTCRTWLHGVQFAAMAVGAHLLEAVQISDMVIFLSTQKVALGCVLSKHLWGRCFSHVEGLFWAQATAVMCTAFLQGYTSVFEGWSLVSIFSTTLVMLTVFFFVLMAAVHVALRSTGALSIQWSPILAGLTTLGAFAVWMAYGIGGWSTHSPDRIPAAWLRDFMAAPEHARFLLVQWPLILLVGIGYIHVAATRAEGCPGGYPSAAVRRKVMHRKAFHALAVALFLPPVLVAQVSFLGFCLLVATLLFIAVETCRIYRVPGFAAKLDIFVNRYLDKREDTRRGDLVLTHLYLLLGCAIPVWLEGLERTAAGLRDGEAARWDSLRLSSGILLIGVGDAFAASFGVRFGRIHWPTSHRTVEGSSAFMVSILLVAGLVWSLALGHEEGAASTAPGVRQVVAYVSATFLSMLLEVYTQSIDNLVLPLYFCPLLRVLGG